MYTATMKVTDFKNMYWNLRFTKLLNKICQKNKQTNKKKPLSMFTEKKKNPIMHNSTSCTQHAPVRISTPDNSIHQAVTGSSLASGTGTQRKRMSVCISAEQKTSERSSPWRTWPPPWLAAVGCAVAQRWETALTGLKAAHGTPVQTRTHIFVMVTK